MKCSQSKIRPTAFMELNHRTTTKTQKGELTSCLVRPRAKIGAGKSCYCTVKETVPTVALAEPDVPVTVIV